MCYVFVDFMICYCCYWLWFVVILVFVVVVVGGIFGVCVYFNIQYYVGIDDDIVVIY